MIHLKKAVNYLENKDTDSALIELLNAVRLDPLNSEAYSKLGTIYLGKKDLPAALKQFLRASSLEKGDLDSHYQAANIYFSGGAMNESKELVDKALALDSDHYESLLLKANIAISEKQYDEAGKILSELLAREKKSVEVFLSYARFLMIQGETEKVEQALMNALDLEVEDISRQLQLIQLYGLFVGEKGYQKIETKLLGLARRYPEDIAPWLVLAELYKKQGAKEKELQAIEKALRVKEDVVVYEKLAQFHMEHQNFDDAFAVLDRAQPLFKVPERGFVIKAGYLFDQKKMNEAGELVEQVLKINPKNHTALLLKARLLRAKGDFVGSMALLDELLTDEPDWGEALVIRGGLFLHLNRIELAFNDALAAFRSEPYNLEANLLLAKISLVKKDYDQVRIYAGNVLKAQPDNIAVMVVGGRALLGLQKYGKALELFTLLDEKASGKVAEFKYYKAASLAGLGKKEDARKLLSTILINYPDSTSSLGLLVQLLMEHGELEEAVVRVQGQIKKVPNNMGHKLLLAKLYEQQSYWKGVIEIYSGLYEATHRDVFGVQLAKALDKAGDSGKAEKLFLTLLKKDPQLVPALYGLAIAYEKRGDELAAIKFYEQVLEVQPGASFAANNLAWLLTQQEGGDFGEALRLSMLAVKSRPEDAVMLDTLGWVHLKRGSYILAEQQFLQALALEPGNKKYREHLILVEKEKIRKEAEGKAEITAQDLSLGIKAESDIETELEHLLQQ